MRPIMGKQSMMRAESIDKVCGPIKLFSSERKPLTQKNRIPILLWPHLVMKLTKEDGENASTFYHFLLLLKNYICFFKGNKHPFSHHYYLYFNSDFFVTNLALDLDTHTHTQEDIFLSLDMFLSCHFPVR